MDLLGAAKTVCADAAALARLQRDGRAWAVLAWPADLAPTPLQAMAEHAGRRRTLLWRDQEWMLAIGDAAAVASDGPGRSTHLAAAAARLESRTAIAVCGPATQAPPLPCLLVAYSFEERAPGPSHWGQGLSGARMWLPRRLLWRRTDGSSWIIAARALTAADHGSGLIAERLIADPVAITPGPPVSWPTLKDDYQDQVEDAISLIRDGAMRKVVLARAVDQRLPKPVEDAAVIDRLHAQSGGDATVYAVDNDDGALFVGASPELLFSAEGQRVTAMALAGSSARGGDATADQAAVRALMDSTKERKEHGVVVEHFVSVLRPRCHGFAVPQSPHPRLLKTLIHLETLFGVDLRITDYLELLGALQPTPAVCGLPTATAAHYIQRHERLHRGLYTGALGWTSPQGCHFIVPLRGAILRGGAEPMARLFAGAGIIETSDPASEYAETELKLEVMRQVLG
jgi:salicylate biosynthesis isochorismate synthase